MLRFGYRTYPHYLLADLQAWQAVENDQEANLALSAEETEILENARCPKSGERHYPLFLNGRAGSGKSTLLHYLMKGYLGFSLRETFGPEPMTPIYLTCSDKLLDLARKNVERLLKIHVPEMIRRGSDERAETKRIEEVKKAIPKAFRIFHHYLYELIPKLVKEAKYHPRNRINYSLFRDLWLKRFQIESEKFHRRISPDVSWHVIRTYIKGMAESSEGWLDPQDYEELPKKQQTVTKEMFEEIYNRVWENWYLRLCSEPAMVAELTRSAGGRFREMHAESPLWDDQDLVLEILKNGQFDELFPVIVCDEAQDFTKNELEFLYRLSLFSGRTIKPYELKNIPFIFAGDPLQTLNPTGFRWDAASALFHQRIVMPLDGTGKSGLDFQYRELRYNYRSSSTIVHFSNLILLLRSALCRVYDTRPQIAWRVEEKPLLPAYYETGNPSIAELLSQTDLVILVNCEEGEEGVFVINDPVLNSVVSRDEEGVPRNVLSPAKAKGLEFNRVVLYRFGDECPEEYEELIRDGGKSFTADRHLAVEYFLNRVYVAATRPKQRLYIVDTRKGLVGFWNFAKDPDMVDRLSAEVFRRNPEDWKQELLCYMREGLSKIWQDDREDPLALANQYLEKGRADRDSYFLRQARLIYKSIGKEREARECLAEAYEYEGNLLGAGKEYAELGDRDKAIDSFWRAKAFMELYRLSERFPDLMSIKHRASALISDGKDATTILGFLRTIHVESSERIESMITDDVWQYVIITATDKLSRLDSGKLSRPEWGAAWLICSHLRNAGFLLPPERIAYIASRAGEKKTSVSLWEEAGVSPDEYKRDKADILGYPANLDMLSDLRAFGEILDLWEKYGPPPAPTERIISEVSDLYISQGKYRKASEVLRLSSSEMKLRDCLKVLSAKNIREEIIYRSVVERLIFILLDQSKYEDAIALTTTDGLDMLAGKHHRLSEIIRDIDRFLSRIITAYIQIIANSDRIACDTSSKPLADHLRILFGAAAERKAVDWSKCLEYVSAIIAGAAIERAGRMLDAMDFYEWARKNRKFGEDLRKHARERLIVCKERFAKIKEKEGESSVANRHRYEARSIREALGLAISVELPEFPILGEQEALVRSMVPDGGVINWKVKNKEYVITVDSGEAKIDNIEECSYAKVDLRKKLLKGGGFRQVGDRYSWTSTTWGMTVNLIDDKGLLTLHLGTEGHEHLLTIQEEIVKA